jgi:hypothetical protein
MLDPNRRGKSPRHRAAWLAVAVASLALAVPSAALGQSGTASPSNAQYQPANQQIAASGGGGGPNSSPSSGPSAASAAGGSSGGGIGGLPFTGLDIGVLALAAVALLGSGLTLRRLTDPARHSSS